MSIKGFDFELNGVKYNAAEDAEGDHYALGGEPLRPPNAVTVQGPSSQKFQMRPDVLQWSLTDWSGGEGAQKYFNTTPNRWRELSAVRVFQKPGTLRAGWYVEDTQDSTGASDLIKDGMLQIGRGGLFLLDFDANDFFTWDEANERWAAATTMTGPSVGVAPTSFTGDDGALYWLEVGTDDLWRLPVSTSTPTKLSDGSLFTDKTASIAMGDYIYNISLLDGKVRETTKDGVSEIEIYVFDSNVLTAMTPAGLSSFNHLFVAATTLDGKLYFVVRHLDKSVIHEITPSTAAGPGFGVDIATFHGFKAWSIWSHGGLLFLGGDMHSVNDDAIMYLQPGGAYGTLGDVRVDEDVGEIVGQTQGSRMLEHYFATRRVGSSTAETAIWEVDSVSGGFCMIAQNVDGDSTGDPVRSVVVFDGDVFVSGDKDATARRIQRARSDQFAKFGEAISAWHDFDLADEKILSSLVLSVEKLPADWTVNVDYAIDNTDTWSTGITYTTTNGKGTKVAISTDSSTKNFRTLSIRIRLTWTGSGIPTSSAVVLGVDAIAQVAIPVRVWRILLDLSDSKSAEGKSGTKKRAFVLAASATKGVMGFKDGYGSRDPNTFEDVDVIMDAYRIVMSTPGEGFASVTLREVA